MERSASAAQHKHIHCLQRLRPFPRCVFAVDSHSVVKSGAHKLKGVERISIQRLGQIGYQTHAFADIGKRVWKRVGEFAAVGCKFVSGQQAQQGGFAGAVCAGYLPVFAFVYAPADIAQHFFPIDKHGHVFQCKQRAGGRLSRRR